MCLSIAVEFPDKVLSRGEHLGFEFITVHNGMGSRCGYIRVPAGHPWHGRDYDDVPAEVHGGLTFGRPDRPCDGGGPDDAHWFGFDCAHAGDAPDPSLPTPAGLRAIHSDDPIRGAVVRTQEYVEAECRELCRQAAAAAAVGIGGGPTP